MERFDTQALSANETPPPSRLADGRRLILASSSPFRRELLSRLGLPFTTLSPAVDESVQTGEAAEDLTTRLARAKAQTIAAQCPNSLVIGSDQVAVLDSRILGKPGHHAAACAQLRSASGKTVRFYTGLCLYDSNSGRAQTAVVDYQVHFRDLSDAMIERYLQRETPYQCAGSFKSERLGIALFSRLQGDDPTALIGLPLIKLVDMLAQEHIFVP